VLDAAGSAQPKHDTTLNKRPLQRVSAGLGQIRDRRSVDVRHLAEGLMGSATNLVDDGRHRIVTRSVQ
jgi:hypothetical protein